MSRRFGPLAALVGFDLLTKYVAMAFIGRVSPPAAGTRFAFYPWLNYPGHRAIDITGTVPVNPAVAAVVFSLTFLLMRRAECTRKARILAYVVSYLFGWLAGAILVPAVRLPGPPALTGAVALSSVLFFGTIWLMLQDDRWRAGFLLLTAGALGNGLSRVLPPFRVVDFIYIRLPFGGVDGNMADSYTVIGHVLLILALTLVIARAVDRQLRASRSTSS